MSAAIFIISGLHAIPPIAGAYFTKSKVGLVIGGIVGAAVAIAIGGGAYAFFDLIGVAVGCFAGYSIVEEAQGTTQTDELEKPRTKQRTNYISETTTYTPRSTSTANEFANFHGGSTYIVGNKTTVRGVVAAVKCFHNRTLIDIGDKFPREEISLLVWDNHVPALMNKFGNLDLLVGQSITCDGVVSIYKGHLQVKINHPDQLNTALPPSTGTLTD